MWRCRSQAAAENDTRKEDGCAVPMVALGCLFSLVNCGRRLDGGACATLCSTRPGICPFLRCETFQLREVSESRKPQLQAHVLHHTEQHALHKNRIPHVPSTLNNTRRGNNLNFFKLLQRDDILTARTTRDMRPFPPESVLTSQRGSGLKPVPDTSNIPRPAFLSSSIGMSEVFLNCRAEAWVGCRKPCQHQRSSLGSERMCRRVSRPAERQLWK